MNQCETCVHGSFLSTALMYVCDIGKELNAKDLWNRRDGQ